MGRNDAAVKNVGEVRQRKDGSYEILISATSDGWESWEGVASFMVRSKPLALPNDAPLAGLSIRDGLIADGWIPPEEELYGYVCDELSRRFGGMRCLRRKGHEPPHYRPNVKWDDGY